MMMLKLYTVALHATIPQEDNMLGVVGMSAFMIEECKEDAEFRFLVGWGLATYPPKLGFGNHCVVIGEVPEELTTHDQDQLREWREALIPPKRNVTELNRLENL